MLRKCFSLPGTNRKISQKKKMKTGLTCEEKTPLGKKSPVIGQSGLSSSTHMRGQMARTLIFKKNVMV